MQKRTFLTDTSVVSIDMSAPIRGLIIINGSDQDAVVQSDSGDQFPCPAKVIATWSLPPTLRVQAKLLGKPTNGGNVNVIATDEPTLNSTSQLSTLAGASGGIVTLAYAEFQAAVLATSSAEGSAVQVVNSGILTLNGTQRIKIEFYCPQLNDSDNTNGAKLTLFDNDLAHPLGELFSEIGNASGSTNGRSVTGTRILIPSAGTHAFFVGINDGGAIGAQHAKASGDVGGSGKLVPGYILVTEV